MMKKKLAIGALGAALLWSATGIAAEWRQLASMDQGRSHLSATAIGNEIYAAGGSGLLAPLTTFEVYDIAYDYWRSLPSMPEAREQFSLTALGGEAFVIGGFGNGGRAAPLDSVWVYSKTISSWREGSAMPIPLARHGAVAHGGSIFVFGGVTEEGVASDRIYVLSGSGSGWREEPVRMPEALADLAVATFEDKIYVIGGRRQNGEVIRTVRTYDPFTRSWATGPDLPGPRAGHTAGAVGGRVHVAGGVSGSALQTYDDHFALDPAAGVWRTVEALRSPRHSLASAVVGDRWYVVGGGAGAGLFTEFTEADVLEVYDPGVSE